MHVVQPDEGESFWQPVPANGYAEVRYASDLSFDVSGADPIRQTLPLSGEAFESNHCREGVRAFAREATTLHALLTAHLSAQRVLDPVNGLSPTVHRRGGGVFALPSVAHYLLVDTQRRLVRAPPSLARRAGVPHQVARSGTLRLDPPGLVLDLDAIYAGSGV